MEYALQALHLEQQCLKRLFERFSSVNKFTPTFLTRQISVGV